MITCNELCWTLNILGLSNRNRYKQAFRPTIRISVSDNPHLVSTLSNAYINVKHGTYSRVRLRWCSRSQHNLLRWILGIASSVNVTIGAVLRTLGHVLRPMLLLARIIAIASIPAAIELRFFRAAGTPLFRFSLFDSFDCLSFAFGSCFFYNALLFFQYTSLYVLQYWANVLFHFCNF